MHRVQIAFPSSLTSLSPIQGFLGSPPKYTTCPPFLVSGSAAGKSSFRRVVTKKDWILGKNNRYSYGKPKKKKNAWDRREDECVPVAEPGTPLNTMTGPLQALLTRQAWNPASPCTELQPSSSETSSAEVGASGQGFSQPVVSEPLGRGPPC